MKCCYTLSRSANGLNINTYKRVLYPRSYVSVPSPSLSESGSSSSTSVSKVSRLLLFTRLFLWIKRHIFNFIC